jgi:hypothetical protein
MNYFSRIIMYAAAWAQTEDTVASDFSHRPR